MHITREMFEELLHVLADELYDALLDHGVGHVDGEDHARHLGLHGVSAVVLGRHYLVSTQAQLGTLRGVQPATGVVEVLKILLRDFCRGLKKRR